VHSLISALWAMENRQSAEIHPLVSAKLRATISLRFTLLASFLNFIHNSVDPDFQNPYDDPALRKLFKAGKPIQFKILEKDVVDEIIFRTQNPRDRLLLELMARGCVRVGEVLKLTPMDIEDRKTIIRGSESGRETEVAFLPQKVADRARNTSAIIALIQIPEFSRYPMQLPDLS